MGLLQHPFWLQPVSETFRLDFFKLFCLEGSLMRVHYSKCAFDPFCLFQLLDACHCWWTSESPRAHVAKFYDRLRLIRSVWRASKIPVLKLIEIVTFWAYYTTPFGFSLFWHFWAILFSSFETTLFCQGSLMRIHYLK